MKNLLALILFFLCVTPVFAESNGLALEAYSNGSAGVAYYQPMWATGITGRYARIDTLVSDRNLVLNPWAEIRASLAPNTTMFAGLSLGFGFLGREASTTISKDLTPGIFSGFEFELTSRLLVKGLVSYSVRSYTTDPSVAHSDAELGATLGLSYFL